MSAGLVGEVERFYASYLKAFNGRDRDAFVRSFAYPCGLVFGSAMTVQANESEMSAFFDNAMAGLQGVGWSRSSAGPVQVWPCSEVLALVVVEIARHGADDSVFDRGRAVYTVGRGAEGWRILTLLEQKPPYADASFAVGP